MTDFNKSQHAANLATQRLNIKDGEDRGVCYMLGRQARTLGHPINGYTRIGNMYVVEFRAGWMDERDGFPVTGWRQRRDKNKSIF